MADEWYNNYDYGDLREPDNYTAFMNARAAWQAELREHTAYSPAGVRANMELTQGKNAADMARAYHQSKAQGPLPGAEALGKGAPAEAGRSPAAPAPRIDVLAAMSLSELDRVVLPPPQDPGRLRVPGSATTPARDGQNQAAAGAGRAK
ncbi:hypothetical protein ACN28G_29075 [Micromonospora sp. WMMA1923]|uniref:hypothetical protein n=1 Tax=Micromonospora sp. WMMA1923 TaxID=3404125 RepID=UPI003B93CCDC